MRVAAMIFIILKVFYVGSQVVNDRNKTQRSTNSKTSLFSYRLNDMGHLL